VSRREAHFDAMLRHLGAAYYQTLRGEAAAADVTGAAEAVTEFQGHPDRGTEAGHGGPGGAPGAGGALRRRGRWLVRDVMTTDVVTAGRNMSYKQAAKLMTDRQVSAIPVVARGGRVVGMVSEADVLRKAERRSWRWGNGLSGRARRDVVTLAGVVGLEDLIPVALGLATEVAGVVAVINGLTRQEAHNG
jgi:hypothetical protein